MEGKNAAFSRNQTGKKEEKKKGRLFLFFFHAGQNAEREREIEPWRWLHEGGGGNEPARSKKHAE